MIQGERPFGTGREDVLEELSMLAEHGRDWIMMGHASDDAQSLVHALLAHDPRDR